MLRSKSNSYKRKRQEINDMTAELQLLKRTEELLKEQVEQIKSRMVRNRTSESVFYLEFFFREGEKLFREGKSVVSNAKTANFGIVKSMSRANPLDKTLFRISLNEFVVNI
jgi:hypothetical protein